jgi:hypothetical protein
MSGHVGSPVAVKARVQPAGGEQLLVRALLDDAAVLEDDDQVGRRGSSKDDAR